jgi:uncharacterized membrane protein
MLFSNQPNKSTNYETWREDRKQGIWKYSLVKPLIQAILFVIVMSLIYWVMNYFSEDKIIYTTKGYVVMFLMMFILMFFFRRMEFNQNEKWYKKHSENLNSEKQ